MPTGKRASEQSARGMVGGTAIDAVIRGYGTAPYHHKETTMHTIHDVWYVLGFLAFILIGMILSELL